MQELDCRSSITCCSTRCGACARIRNGCMLCSGAFCLATTLHLSMDSTHDADIHTVCSNRLELLKEVLAERIWGRVVLTPHWYYSLARSDFSFYGFPGCFASQVGVGEWSNGQVERQQAQLVLAMIITSAYSLGQLLLLVRNHQDHEYYQRFMKELRRGSRFQSGDWSVLILSVLHCLLGDVVQDYGMGRRLLQLCSVCWSSPAGGCQDHHNRQSLTVFQWRCCSRCSRQCRRWCLRNSSACHEPGPLLQDVARSVQLWRRVLLTAAVICKAVCWFCKMLVI